MHSVLLFLVLVLFAVANPGENAGDVLESEFVATYSSSSIGNVITQFYPADQTRPPRYGVDEYRIRFTTETVDGEPVEIVAQMYIPRTDQPETLPVYVMGAGSTGLADTCAPTNERPEVQNWGSYRAFLMTIATQGYITIMPNYAGLDDPDRIQPYYVSEMEARVLLDAGRAVYTFFDADSPVMPLESAATPNDQVILSGYSQGGHAVLAAKDLLADYAPELPVVGVIAYAPARNMQNHMEVLPQLAPFRMVAWADYYGDDRVNLNEIFDDRWLPDLEADALTMCVGEAVGHFSARPDEMYRPEFLEALQNETLDEDYPALYELFELNNPGFVPSDLPTLMTQAPGDHSLPMDAYEQFMDAYCAAGNHMTMLLNERVTHLRARQESYRDVLEWMDALIAGETLRDDCDAYRG